MITRDQILEWIEAKPFRQFMLETSGGNYIAVESPAHISLPPPGFDLINVYGTDGLVHYIVEGAILGAAVYGPEPSLTRKESTAMNVTRTTEFWIGVIIVVLVIWLVYDRSEHALKCAVHPEWQCEPMELTYDF